MMRQRRIGRVLRAVMAPAAAAVATVALAGCFMIPLADGRSPFDDPFGPSFTEVRAQLPALQEALDEALTGDDWAAQAVVASDNCEGACNLRLGIDLAPSSASAEDAVAAAPDAASSGWLDLAVPPETLSAILEAGAPVAADAKRDLTVSARCLGEAVTDATGAEVTVCADLTDIAQAITGSDDDYFDGPFFSAAPDEITLRTSTWAVDEILSRIE
ncbi:hypothetical protein [Microbacterium jejuense]|uniref:hypothetical protein n=1 Tax=Microbacterium jejuense TaxID=1263637 RepID=UPI0031EB647A